MDGNIINSRRIDKQKEFEPTYTKMIIHPEEGEEFRLNTQDESLYAVIKRNGVVVDISLEDAKNQNDGIYSIDYTPSLNYNYTPINSTIRVKAVIRRFGPVQTNPYISSIKVRKYGGDLLWMETL